MRNLFRIIPIAISLTQLAAFGATAANYVLDNNTSQYPLNASDGTETLDNWFANEFTALADANLITRVDFGVYTTAPGAVADVFLYRVTDPGGNPALGATRVYTQAFSPLTGDGSTWSLQPIVLATPVAFDVGDKFLVSVFIANVNGAAPNDMYPYVLDTSGVASGTYWARSAPNSFNLDNLAGAKPVNQVLTAGGFAPGDGHIIIRALGVPVPEPSACALGALGILLLAVFRRRVR